MISVAICTYNGEKYIQEQLESIIHQTVIPDEIVVCDDCSEDDTIKIVNNILQQWSGIYQVVINNNNIGFKRNFQKAIGLCSGDIIFLSDQDDVWNLNKLRIMLKVFDEHKDAGLVFHDAEIVNDKLELIYKSFWRLLKFSPKKFLAHNYNRLLEGNVVQGSACAFRKHIFFEAMPFPPDAIHDEWLALTAIRKNEIFPIPAILMKYRQSDQNVLGVNHLSFLQKINTWRLNLNFKLDIYYKELLRKRVIYNIYNIENKNDISLIAKINFKKYNTFLKQRIYCIQNNKMDIELFFLYFHMPISNKYALKNFFKDLLVTCFLKHDKYIK